MQLPSYRSVMEFGTAVLLPLSVIVKALVALILVLLGH